MLVYGSWCCVSRGGVDQVLVIRGVDSAGGDGRVLAKSNGDVMNVVFS